jgi:hypothetical protein
MVRSFIGGLGLLAAQFAPQAECAPQQTDAEALYEAWQNTIKHMDAQAECAPLQTDAEALYELPERVIDQLYQSAGVSTFHPDGDQREKLYAFANAVAAETVARIAAPTPERADADTAGAKPTCPHCGLTDIEFSRVCHNSACSGYAKEESFYRGWENTVAPASQERADAGKDAARYRWLREQDDSGPLFVMYGSNGTWGECGHSDIYGELLDESIDEEIAKEAKK